MRLRLIKLTEGVPGRPRKETLGFLFNYHLSPGGEKTIDLTGNLINFPNLTDKVRGTCCSRPPTRQCICHDIKLPAPQLRRELLLEGLRSAVASDPGGVHPTPVMPYWAPFRKVLHAEFSGVQSSKSGLAITCEVKTANCGKDGLDDCKKIHLVAPCSLEEAGQRWSLIQPTGQPGGRRELPTTLQTKARVSSVGAPAGIRAY